MDAVHCGPESEHQVLNDSHIFVSFMGILLLFGTKFQYSCKRRQDEEGKQSDKASIRDLVLTFCPTMRSVQQRKLKLLMLVYMHFRWQRQLICEHQNQRQEENDNPIKPRLKQKLATSALKQDIDILQYLKGI